MKAVRTIIEYRETDILKLPMAVICADSFHVIKNLNDSFNRIRIRIMKKLKKANMIHLVIIGY